MFTNEVIINDAALDGLSDFIAYVPQLAQDIAEEQFERFRPQLISELATTPGSVRYPIEWTSERQRKAYFATDGFGAGIPYRRTGALSAGWYAALNSFSGGFNITIGNSQAYAPYVVGLLQGGGNWQQQFHRNTGWQPVRPTIEFWTDAYSEAFIMAFMDYF